MAGRCGQFKVPHSASLELHKPTPTFIGHRSSRQIDGPRAHFSRPHHNRTRTAIYAPLRGRANLECDAQADVPLAEASGATCVQRLDDSRDSAIHTKYRISLRSSSMREPRYPLPRVVFLFFLFLSTQTPKALESHFNAWISEVRGAPVCWC